MIIFDDDLARTLETKAENENLGFARWRGCKVSDHFLEHLQVFVTGFSSSSLGPAHIQVIRLYGSASCNILTH
jgi:hypothetical protein